jgi:hypothetical protein
MDMMKEKEAEIQRETEEKTVLAKTSKNKQVKTASVENTKEKVEKAEKAAVSKNTKEAKKTENTKKVKISKKIKKEEQNFSIKEVKASKESITNKLGVVWKSLKSEAALSPEDRNFLIEYFKRYYPADYAEALIAQY